MQRLRTVTLLDVSAVAGHHAMPAALLLTTVKVLAKKENDSSCVWLHSCKLESQKEAAQSHEHFKLWC